jgi:hypothetical protein
MVRTTYYVEVDMLFFMMGSLRSLAVVLFFG